MGGAAVKSPKTNKNYKNRGEGRHGPLISTCRVFDDSILTGNIAIKANSLAKAQNTFILGPELTQAIFGFGYSSKLLCLVARVCKYWYIHSSNNSLWLPFIGNLASTDTTKFKEEGYAKRIASACALKRQVLFPVNSMFATMLRNGCRLPQYTDHLKMVVFGCASGCVGKTALIFRFISDVFEHDYDPVIEDSYRKQISLSANRSVVVDLLNTAAQEEFSAMRDQWMRYGEGFFVVYSVTNKDHIKEARTYMEQISRVKDTNCRDLPILLIGNKCDLEDERQITPQEGFAIAKEYGVGFLETSAKERINVQLMFTMMAELILMKRNVDDSVVRAKD